MKFCKDCNWFRRPAPSSQMDMNSPIKSDPKCGNPEALCNTDMIWGFDIFYTADAMRKSPKACGPEARWFQELPSSGANHGTFRP